MGRLDLAATPIGFDATDAVAGFSGSDDWELQRRKATWNGTACGTYANDGSPTLGTTNAQNQVVTHPLALDNCYQWTLTATDSNSNAVATPITSGTVRVDPGATLGTPSWSQLESWDLGAGDGLSVNPGTGNLVISHPIVSLPIRGSSVDLHLTYNRQDATNVGMGTGWRLDALRRLAIAGTGEVTFTDGTGARHTFTNPQVNGSVTTYTRPTTIYATLVKDTTQTAHEFVLTYRHQARDKFDISGSTGLLVRGEDRFGNGVDLGYTSGNLTTITDTVPTPDRVITLGWDTGPAIDKLTSITDWAAIDVDKVYTPLKLDANGKVIAEHVALEVPGGPPGTGTNDISR